jgi:acyl-homoserine lactone acylase PvdQ
LRWDGTPHASTFSLAREVTIYRDRYGVPHVFGKTDAAAAFGFAYAQAEDNYGRAGGTYVSVVEFGPQVRALTLHTFGASGHPELPHFFDQAPLYATGRFKPGWFTLAEVQANAERSYRPGEER